MDALVKAALGRVNETLGDINWEYPEPNSIAKAIYSVDALKSALKTLTPKVNHTPAERFRNNPEAVAEYIKATQPNVNPVK